MTDKENNYSSYIPKAQEIGALGLAGLSGKLNYDIGVGLDKVNDWDSSMQKVRQAIGNPSKKGLSYSNITNKYHAISENQALDALEKYIKGGLESSNHKLLGLKSGNLPKYFTQLAGWQESIQPLLGKIKTGDQGFDHWLDVIAKRTNKGKEHYNLFMNAKTPSELHGHFIEKGLNALDPKISQDFKIKYPEKWDKLIHSPGPLFAKIKTAPKEFQGALTEAILGYGSVTNNPKDSKFLLPELAGEINRLAGNSKTQLPASTIYNQNLSKLRGIKSNVLKPLALASGLFSLGSYANRNIKKEATVNEDNLDLVNASTAAVLAPRLINSGFRDLHDPSRKKLGITFGEIDIDKAHVGRGHAEPALALEELLKEKFYGPSSYKKTGLFKLNPEDIRIERIIRNKSGLLDHPGGKFNTILNTGFGISTPEEIFDGNLRGKGLKSNSVFKTNTLVNYLTDMTPQDKIVLGATTKDKLKGAKTQFLGYGPGFENIRSRNIKGLGPASFISVGEGMTPALTNSALDLIKNTPNTPQDAREYIQNAINDSNKFKGREDSAKQLGKFLVNSDGKKVLVISGASRGDYVASRARDAADYLKKNNIKDVHILAQMGSGAYSDPIQRKIIEGLDDIVTPVGFLPKDVFLAAQSAGLHAMTSGASSAAEAIGSKAPLGIPGDKGSWGYLKNYGTILDPDNKTKMLKGSIAHRLMQLIHETKMPVPGKLRDYAQAAIGTWNEGNIDYVKNLKGVAQQKGYNMEDVVNLLRDDTRMKALSDQAALRGPEELNKILTARENTANHMLKTLRKNYLKGSIKNLSKIGIGTAVAGTGIKSIYDLVNSKKETILPPQINQNIPDNNSDSNPMNPNLKKGLIGAGALVGTGLLSTYIYKKLKDKKKRDAQKAIYNSNYSD